MNNVRFSYPYQGDTILGPGWGASLRNKNNGGGVGGLSGGGGGRDGGEDAVPVSRAPAADLSGLLGQPVNMQQLMPWLQRMPGMLGPMTPNQQSMNLSQNNPVDPLWYYQQMLSKIAPQYRQFM